MQASTKVADLATYLAGAGVERRTVRVKAKHVFFSQGSSANAVFYLESGRAKLTVVSTRGKEAIVTLLSAGDFIGEESLAEVPGRRTTTAEATTACTALKLDREEMVRLLHEQPQFSALFLTFVMRRGVRTQEDLIDQLFNSSEKRLARTLLLMAEFGEPGEPEMLIPPSPKSPLQT